MKTLIKQINNNYSNFYLKLLLFWGKWIIDELKIKKIGIYLYRFKNKKKIWGTNLLSHNFILDILFKNKLFLNKFWFLNKNQYNYPTLTIKGLVKKKLIINSKTISYYFNEISSKIYSKVSVFFLFLNKKILDNSTLLVSKKLIKIIYSKKQKKYIIIKLAKKKINHNILLNITFKKRNTFFNISKSFGKTVYLTSVRKEGYVGRKRTQYNSIFSVMRLVRKIILDFFIIKESNLAIVYKGWSRFRFSIKKALNVRGDNVILPINYVKYLVKIPHNGCRPPKKRNRKKSKRFFK